MSALELPERLNAAAGLVDAHLAQGRGQKTAILCGDRSVTYQELHEGVNRLGNALLSLGVRMEERVAILLPDMPEWAFAFFGSMKIGAVAVPVNTMPQAPGLRVPAQRLPRPRAGHPSLAPGPDRPRSASRLKFLKYVVRCRRRPPRAPGAGPAHAGGIARPGTGRHQQGRHGLLALQLGHHGLSQGDDPPPPRHARRGRALRQGRPSACGNRTSRSRWRSCSSPTGWATGCTSRCGSAAPRSCSPTGPRPRRSSRPSTATSPPSSTACPPATPRCCTRRRRPGGQSLGRVRMCVSAGEPLPKHIFDKWRERFGVEILDGIGSTEILHIFISNRPGKAIGREHRAGRARLRGEDRRRRRPRAAARPGRHAVDQGRQHRRRLLEQARGHQATPSAASGSTPTTSSSVDEDGYFWYAGRTDDMMKVSGQAVWPTDVEGLLQAHPAVLESGVVGTADPDGLIKPVAYVVLKDGASGFAATWPTSSRSSSRRTRPPTSTLGRWCSSTCCPRRPRARSSVSSSASWPPARRRCTW